MNRALHLAAEPQRQEYLTARELFPDVHNLLNKKYRRHVSMLRITTWSSGMHDCRMYAKVHQKPAENSFKKYENDINTYVFYI